MVQNYDGINTPIDKDNAIYARLCPKTQKKRYK